MIIWGDETVSRLALRVVQAAHGGRMKIPAHALEVIDFSLGNPEFFEQMTRKSALQEACSGILTPSERKVQRPEDVDEFARLCGYPVVLKRDFAAGGEGVAISNGPGDTRAHFARLNALRSDIRVDYISPGSPLDLDENPAFVAQRFVRGNPVNYSLVALRGNILAGFGAFVLQESAANSISSVIRLTGHEAMAEVARTLIGRLGYTGFAGLDFIIEEGTGDLYFLELNPRPTPQSHLGAAIGMNLCTALYVGLNDGVPERVMPSQSALDVALFPQEWWRDPESRWFKSPYHDFPWDDPELIQRYGHSVPITESLSSTHTSEHRAQRPAPSRL